VSLPVITTNPHTFLGSQTLLADFNCVSGLESGAAANNKLEEFLTLANLCLG